MTRVTFPPARKEEREAAVIHGTPWVPRVTGGPVCTYTEPHICGPWHGAQLGGPIPLTRSQHPSLAIIPLGGSLTKDLIKYCYTRNLIPLLPPLPLQLPSGEIWIPECAALSYHSLDPRENFWPPSISFSLLPFNLRISLFYSLVFFPFVVVDHFAYPRIEDMRSYRVSSDVCDLKRLTRYFTPSFV